ncbi:MAG TPA: MFS transporter [Thermoanaerobaculia bacterium]|nr:MFS transporter [Thermoanaerobaculia bacterium]
MFTPRRTALDPLFTPQFAGMWVFAFITFFSAFQLLPGIPFRILELGGTKAQAGWFLAVYTFASALAGPLMGNIADHVGRRRLLVTASILFVGFSVLYGVVRVLPLLLIIGAIHGSIWSGILSSASAIMSHHIPESRRTEGLAYWGLASTAAVAVAPAVGLWVYHFGWTVLCTELAIISAMMAIWASRLPLSDADQQPEEGPSIRTAFDWPTIRASLTLTTISFGYGGVTSYAAILATERHIAPRSIYFSVFATTIVLFRIATAHLGDRYGTKQMLYPSLACLPAAFAILAIAHQRWEMIASAILFGIGFGGAYPAFASWILDNTDFRRRARTFGSIILAFDIGIGTGSAVIGVVGEHYGLGHAFALACVLSCLSIPIFAMTSKRMAVAEGRAGR